MIAGTANLTLQAGDTYCETVAWTTSDPTDPTGKTPGPAVDLTGASAKLSFYNAQLASVLTLSTSGATTNGSTLTIDGKAGTITILILPADSDLIVAGSYSLIVTQGIYVSTILTGTVAVNEVL
ncbi:MAG TPA: hypothetical protein VFN53_06435 [Acidobacteriaceae bacterium]|nr:hypothetical protein [Acidobacteriaceae bacterium]